MQTNTPSLDQLKRATAIAERIQALEAELASILDGATPSVKKESSPAASAPVKNGRRGKRTMSPEARARIAAAQRARWAKSKGGATTPAKAAPSSSSAAPAGKKRKSGLTPEGRAKLAASMKARWAARKKGGPAPTARK